MSEATPLASEQITQEDCDLAFVCVPMAMIFAETEEHIADARRRAAEHIARHRIAALSASPAPSGQGVSGEVAKPKWSMEDYDAFVTLEGWLNEYRRSMDADVLHSWAADMVQSGKALLAIRDHVLDILSPAPAPSCAPGEVERLKKAAEMLLWQLERSGRTIVHAHEMWNELRDAAAALSPQGLDAATVERCAQVADRWAASEEANGEGGGRVWAAALGIAAAIRAGATS